MTKLHKLLCLFSLCLLPSCDYIFPSTWNYRITVEIETPEGIKTGSAVRQVRANLGWRFLTPQAHPINYEVIGEAVVVDLGERGVLFALINWNSYEEVYKAFPYKTFDHAERIKYYRNLKAGTKAELKTNHPKMVTFTDTDDPKSVKLVYFRKIYANGYNEEDNFEDILGAGVRLKSLTIEITNKPVTWGVEKYLPNGAEKLNMEYYEFKKGKKIK